VKAGGVPTFVEGRALALASDGDVIVCALSDRSNQTTGTAGQLVFHIGDCTKFKLFFLVYWFNLCRFILKHRPEKIEIHNIPVGLPVFILSLFSKVSRPKYFFHGPARQEKLIENDSWLSAQTAYFLEAVCMFCSAEIVCVSDAFTQVCKAEHRLIAKFRTISRMYPRIKAGSALVHKERSIECDPLHFVCVRRLVKRTGVLELVDAFNQALELGKIPTDTKLTIIGTGPLHDQLDFRISSSRYASNYSLLGRVSDGERDAILSSSDWNIVPTQGLEGFGLVILEAAFMGCPSLVTNVNALPEVIDQLDNIGRVVELGVSSIMDGLVTLERITADERLRLRDLAIERFGVCVD
jgi:glycosyltransferase involved in cell wall biosynthesis